MSPRLAAPLIALSLGLASPAAASADAPLRVLATVGVLADVAAAVGGPCTEVESLIAADVDPHEYSARPSDIGRLESAELILYVDFALEEQLASALERFAERVPTLGVLAAAFDRADLLSDPDSPNAIDPHVWMDARKWSRLAPVIAEAVADARPACAADARANADTFVAQLDALHGWVADAIATIPEGRRLLVTAHDAFEYFSAAYGIEASEAIEGLSTTTEASIADIRAVADFVTERQVPAVFVETTVNPRTIEAMVQEVRARGHDVAIGGTLYSDGMGAAGTAEGTYIGMLRANTVTIVNALGGTLPSWPEALVDWAEAWSVSD
ncbi:zinc ABC transporter substrate-binding protein [Pararhodobacter sp. SW119]|uniref:metal ABC transporter solute-binding protein, Zn/Mn family n=1 Tax=Pararhodobacter sp. SW119 TaxID=2780075 RepID=UPI001AE0D5AF|nr:zinc ABC transporter substrate-binding protein [Pararhodobacter sp. SW119]